mmetsp:Transcript_30332/g.63339  ORF Transcript_30332/g.63339 Transcript_30332/m.63339 type:complete len:83 (-) Transcript_30332:12-260(-)
MESKVSPVIAPWFPYWLNSTTNLGVSSLLQVLVRRCIAKSFNANDSHETAQQGIEANRSASRETFLPTIFLVSDETPRVSLI